MIRFVKTHIWIAVIVYVVSVGGCNIADIGKIAPQTDSESTPVVKTDYIESPLAVTKHVPTSYVGEPSGEASEPVEDIALANLFDGNTDSLYLIPEKKLIRITFATKIPLKRIKVYGTTSCKFNIYTGSEKTRKDSLSLQDQELNESWNTLETSETVETDSVLLELLPGDENDGIGEIEFWSSGECSIGYPGLETTMHDLKNHGAVAFMVANNPGHLSVVQASPSEISVSPGESGTGNAAVTFTLTRDATLIKRAYLSYQANTTTPVSIKKRINGYAWTGGFTVPVPKSSSLTPLAEEINPLWLVKGVNEIDFQVTDTNLTIKDITIVYETDSGWNTIISGSIPQAVDGNNETSAAIDSVTPQLDLLCDREIQPETIFFHINAATNTKLILQYRQDQLWYNVKDGWTIDLSKFKAGWNAVAIPEAISSTMLRIALVEGGNPASINEVRLVGSPIGSPYTEPKIVVSYPRNGEYYGRTAYIQGFAIPKNPFQLSVEGKAAPSNEGNAISLSLSKDETKYSAQTDNDPWTINARGQLGMRVVTQPIALTNNLLSSGTGTQGPNGGSTPGTPGTGSSGTEYTVEVSPDAAKTINYGDLTITIPLGAINEKITITIIPLSKPEVATLNPGMINVTSPAAGYRFLVNGKAHYSFKKPITISFAYSRSQFIKGQSDNDVFMYFFSDAENSWKRLQRVTVSGQASSTSPSTSLSKNANTITTSNKDSGSVTSATDHFTDIINATLTVPENPDPLLYNPNTIRDIKVGNPTEGITLIQPPAINSRGDAQLSYPLDIPPGRNGMQPTISIQYNSSHANGWLGVGWDIPINSIEIDTTFGVPRYDGTETYLFNGERLVPVGNNEYKPRVEGTFNKIIRHGTMCNNYWWEIIDKNGTKYTYGRSPSARLKNYRNFDGSMGDNGNIFKWCLETIRDTNGNTINYYYFQDIFVKEFEEQVDYNLVHSKSEPFTQVYLNRISYTGSNDVDGKYAIIFNIDKGRPDVEVTGRSGFQIATRYRLNSIDVLYDNSIVKKYNLKFKDVKPSHFYKTLLEKVEQLDRNNQVFYSHDFEYYNDLSSDGDGDINGFESMGGIIDDLAYFFAPIFHRFGYDQMQIGSIRGGVGTEHYQLSYMIWGSQPFSDGNSDVVNDTMFDMIDLDGDALPDQVYIKNQKVFYRKNKGLIDNQIQFGMEAEIESLSGQIDSLCHETNDVGSFGLNTSRNPQNAVRTSPPYLDRSLDNSIVISSYFSDINGDGLMDFVVNNAVFYNSLDINGSPQFSLSRPAGFGSDTDRIFKINQSIKYNADGYYQKFNFEDPLLIWVAPYDGVISISGDVEMISSSELYSQKPQTERYSDGAIARIEKISLIPSVQVLWYNYLSSPYSYYPPTPCRPNNVSNVPILKGEKIIFRINSKYDGVKDVVKWNPQIRYVSDGEGPSFNQDLKDENGHYTYKFSALDDFVLNSSGLSQKLMNGSIKISGELKKDDKTSDDINVKLIFLDRETGYESTAYSQTIGRDEVGVVALHLPSSIRCSAQDELICKLESDTPIDWTKISWKPIVEYVAIDGISPIEDASGKPLYTFAVSVQKSVCPVKDANAYYPYKPQGKSGMARIIYKIRTHDNLSNTLMDESYRAEITLAVKKQNELLCKEKGVVEKTSIEGEITIDTEININESDSLYFICASNDNDFEQFVQIESPVIYFESDNGRDADGKIKTNIRVDADAVVYKPNPNNYPLAGGFHSWYFGRWNGTSIVNGYERLSEIIPTKMILPDSTQLTGTELEKYEQIIAQLKTYSPMIVGKRQVLTGGTIEDLWIGMRDDNCSIGKVTDSKGNKIMTLSSTRYMKKQILVGSSSEPIIQENDPDLRGALKINRSDYKGSYNSSMLSDSIDMNGDRYPDYLLGPIAKNNKPASVQFTRPNGSVDTQCRQMRIEPVAKNYQSGNYGNTTTESLIDFNGDGLPDYVSNSARPYAAYPGNPNSKQIWVNYNLGYDFSDYCKISSSFNQLMYSKRNITHSALPLPNDDLLWYFQCAAAVGLTETLYNDTKQNELIDVNGDGLPDYVSYDNTNKKIYVTFNTGSEFAPEKIEWKGSIDPNLIADDTIQKGEHAGAANNIMCYGWRLYFMYVIGTSRATMRSTSRMMDINGDGLIDQIKIDKNGRMYVALNKTGRTNLLKKVNRPLGGSFAMDYKREGNTSKMPQSIWVLSSISVNDGNGNILDRSYSYNDGNYDRSERSFYGFGEIKDVQPDGTVVVTTVHNDDYYLKGLVSDKQLRDGDNLLLQHVHNEYSITSLAEKIGYPHLDSTTTFIYEKGCAETKLTGQQYTYDQYGNVKTYIDYGDDGVDDDVVATIGYYSGGQNYIVGKPNQITVKAVSDGRMLRERVCTYDGRGNLLTLRQSLDIETKAATKISYSVNGNIDSVTAPATKNNEGYCKKFTYDAATQTQVASIKDSHGYESKVEYDPVFPWKVSKNFDINGETTQYSYDSFGRLKTVEGPKNVDGQGSVSITYNTAFPASAKATNNSGIPGDPSFDVVTYVDGLGRNTRVQKSNETGYATTSYTYDDIHRTVVETLTNGTQNTTVQDERGRKTLVATPGMSVSFTYGLQAGLFTSTKNLNGKQVSVTRTDVKGLIKSITEGGSVTTNYDYNPMGEISSVIDHKGNKTTVEYDLSGRRTAIDNPDTGRVEYEYDDAGNLVNKKTPNLRGSGKSIRYEYEFNRVAIVSYPDSGMVRISYGGPGEGGGRRGRIMRIEGNGFSELRTYDALGNVSEISKTIAVTAPTASSITKVMKYSYDAFGRMRTIAYPDGEIVTYRYNKAGLLKKVSSGSAVYIDDLQYNNLGQRTLVKYGNDVVTNYEYDDSTNRLSAINSILAGKTIQNINMTYNDDGNITDIENRNYQSVTGDSLTTTKQFGYDNLMRLVSSTGTHRVNGDERYSYTNTITYDTIGNITKKNQTNLYTPSGGSPVNVADSTYSYTYQYGSSRPHAVTAIGTQAFQYDLNGNMTAMSDSSNGFNRSMIWDEENRLKRCVDNGVATDYSYDYSGKRIIKRGTYGESVYINENYSIRNGDVESKQIFAGNARVATRMKIANAGESVYYHHGDHLGSGNVVTRQDGAVNEHIEYLPYGETWVHEKVSASTESMPYKYTSKEQDPETGLYYYGARYYDAKVSRWVSTDPALERYLPAAGKGSDGLPGLGGVYNSVNSNSYSFSGNNPIMLVDPDGRVIYQNGYILPYVASEVGFNSNIPRDSQGNHALMRIQRGFGPGHPGVDSYPYVAQSERLTYQQVSVANGVVVFAGERPGYGNTVEIFHGYDQQNRSIITRYAHLSTISDSIRTGSLIYKDQVFGNTGNTGMSGGEHSHYEILINGIPIDPLGIDVEKLMKIPYIIRPEPGVLINSNDGFMNNINSFLNFSSDRGGFSIYFGAGTSW